MHVQLQAHETHAGAAINPAARQYNTYACIMSLSSHVTLRAHPQAVAPAYMVGSPRKDWSLRCNSGSKLLYGLPNAWVYTYARSGACGASNRVCNVANGPEPYRGAMLMERNDLDLGLCTAPLSSAS